MGYKSPGGYSDSFIYIHTKAGTIFFGGGGVKILNFNIFVGFGV